MQLKQVSGWRAVFWVVMAIWLSLSGAFAGNLLMDLVGASATGTSRVAMIGVCTLLAHYAILVATFGSKPKEVEDGRQGEQGQRSTG